MIRQDEIIADLHTHTNFSLHAYSTVKENIEMAVKNGMQYIAITDHFYGDGTDIQQKNEISRLKYLERTIDRTEKKIHILGGVEFNFNQDIPYEKLKKLNWKLIGLHSWFVDFPEYTLDDIYTLYEESLLRRKKYNAFAHIEREIHKVEHGEHRELDKKVREFLRKICDLAKKNNIYLEVNESSLENNEGGNAERLEYWLRYAKENGNSISMGTDAHYCDSVGLFPKSIELLNRVDFPKEKILNCNYDMLIELKKY